jgi:hypothetical protein
VAFTVPATFMLVMLTVLLLLFFKVAALDVALPPTFTVPKLRVEGVRETNAPIPVRFTACEPLPSLSVILTVPERAPVVVGLKVAVMVQLLPAARVLPQLFVWL